MLELPLAQTQIGPTPVPITPQSAQWQGDVTPVPAAPHLDRVGLALLVADVLWVLWSVAMSELKKVEYSCPRGGTASAAVMRRARARSATRCSTRPRAYSCGKHHFHLRCRPENCLAVCPMCTCAECVQSVGVGERMFQPCDCAVHAACSR